MLHYNFNILIVPMLVCLILDKNIESRSHFDRLSTISE